MFFIVFQIKYKIKKNCKWIEMEKNWYCRYKLPKHNDKYQWTIPTNEWKKPIRGPINPKLNEENLEDGFGEPPENHEDELHGDLNQLRILNDELKNTREPSRVSLTTSLQNIIESINIARSEITNLSQYRAWMREHYATGISKEDIKTWISQKPNCGENL